MKYFTINIKYNKKRLKSNFRAMSEIIIIDDNAEKAPKKRKLSNRYIEITNNTFIKWFTDYKKDKPFLQPFLQELDDQDNWTFRLKCTGNCRRNNQPFSVKETGCPTTIKVFNGIKFTEIK
jgi:hypothetical protein